MSTNTPTIILMCPPTYFDIDYSINPWMDVEYKVDHKKAQDQWQNLYETINKILLVKGGKIQLMEPVKGSPDLVFIDAGLTYGFEDKKIFIPSNFMHLERQAEADIFADWFADNGYELVWLDEDYKFEGHGDTLWAGNSKLFCGYGFRSQEASFEQIYETLVNKLEYVNFEMIPLELVDSRFYHLDTCFCPISETVVLCFEDALSPKSLDLLKTKMEIIAVSEADALKFACNSLVIDKNIIIPTGAIQTNDKLEKLGYTVHQVDVSEFMKSGGACKCMSMQI